VNSEYLPAKAGKVDAYVAALGSYSPLLLKRVEISLPVFPIEGYSITVPLVNAARAPQSTVMDETCKVAITGSVTALGSVIGTATRN
jgi:glycine/D-amino acid oxidase-like deaminating enzyme